MVVLIGLGGVLVVLAAATAFVFSVGSIVRLVDDDRRGVAVRSGTTLAAENNSRRRLTPESRIRAGVISFIAGMVGIYLLAQIDPPLAFAETPFSVLGIVLIIVGEQARHTEDR